MAYIKNFVDFTHFLRVAQSHVGLLKQFRLRRCGLLLHVLQAQSDAHALKEQPLGHRWPRLHPFGHLGDLSYLSKVHIGSQIELTHLWDDLVPIFDQLMVFNSSERIAESVVFSIVNNQRCTFADLDERANILREFICLRAYFELITHF